jgi:hypothetical protein
VLAPSIELVSPFFLKGIYMGPCLGLEHYVTYISNATKTTIHRCVCIKRRPILHLLGVVGVLISSNLVLTTVVVLTLYGIFFGQEPWAWIPICLILKRPMN